MGIENRRHRRAVPDGAIQVRDAITGQMLGTVGNLSASGLMLISNRPIEADCLFQLSFTVTDSAGRDRDLEVGAESLWSSPASQPDVYWAGFEIVEISDDDHALLSDITG